MLKFIFFCLLIANVLLFALSKGYVANPLDEPRQPQRLAQQLSPENLKLISAEVATAPEIKPEVAASLPVASQVAASATASSASVSTPSPAAKPQTFACLEWGVFANTDLNKVEERLKSLAFGNRQARLNVMDTSTTMVFIPPLGSKDAADKKALELNHLGVHDFFIIQDQSSMRWGISLGVFKSEESAKQLLATLVGKGVHSAKLGTHTTETNKFNFVFKNVSDPEHSGLVKLKSDFPAQDLHVCKSG